MTRVELGFNTYAVQGVSSKQSGYLNQCDPLAPLAVPAASKIKLSNKSLENLAFRSANVQPCSFPIAAKVFLNSVMESAKSNLAFSGQGWPLYLKATLV